MMYVRTGAAPIMAIREDLVWFTSERLTRLSYRVEERLQAISRARGLGVEDVHDLRSDLRRLRIWFRPWRRMLTRGSASLGKDIDRQVAELARLSGDVRDRDIGLELLKPPSKLSAVVRRNRYLKAAQETLAKEGKKGRRLLVRSATVMLDAQTLPALRMLVTQLRTASLAFSCERSLVRESEQCQRRVIRSFDRAVARPTIQRLHELRIALREVRIYQEAVPPRVGMGFNRPAERLQRRLGELHDLDVLCERLRSLTPSAGLLTWSERVESERDQQLRRVTRNLRRARMHGVVRSIGP